MRPNIRIRHLMINALVLLLLAAAFFTTAGPVSAENAHTAKLGKINVSLFPIFFILALVFIFYPLY